MLNSVSILGVFISLVTNQTVIPLIFKLLEHKLQLHIVTPNPEHIIQAQSSPEFKAVLNKADFAVPDGIGVVWAVRHLYPGEARRVERVTGTDLMVKLCEVAAARGWKVGLIGGQDGVAQEAANQLIKKYSNLTIEVISQDYDISEDNDTHDKEIVKKIRQTKSDMVFVALGAPYQELWIAKMLPQLPSVKIAMGVGGAFDFISGRVKRAPVWMQQAGFEWLYRLAQEPWRWKRQLRLVQFGWQTITRTQM